MENSLEIKISISNYDELVKQLEHIKKLLQEINEIGFQVEAK